MKMIPPYGKPLAQSQAEQNPPNNDIYIFIGKKAWERAKASAISRPTRTLCLPPHESPFKYQWPVAMCDILIFDSGLPDEELVHDLVSVLFECHAIIVRYVSHDGLLTIFKRN
jgi:hypothetical protein